MSDIELPAGLVAYLRSRQQLRADDVRTVMAEMTPFERRLASEVATMGWVLGFRAAEAGATSISDRPKLPLVIDACLGMSDLYPVVAFLLAGGQPHEAGDWMPEVQLS